MRMSLMFFEMWLNIKQELLFRGFATCLPAGRRSGQGAPNLLRDERGATPTKLLAGEFCVEKAISALRFLRHHGCANRAGPAVVNGFDNLSFFSGLR